jgi:hypothetical protein
MRGSPNTRGSILKGGQTQMDQICTLAVLRNLSSRHVRKSRRKSRPGVVLHRIRRFDDLAVSQLEPPAAFWAPHRQ